MRAIQVFETGPPEVLTLTDLPDPTPGPGQVLIEVAAAGVNLADARFRSGDLPARLPFIPGYDAVGSVAAVGDGVDDELVGQVVAAATGICGGYAELVLAAVGDVFLVPAGLSIQHAAGVFQSGRSALRILRRAGIKRGDTALISAAAGSTGILLVQLVSALGATVVAVVGDASKAALPAQLGATLVVDGSKGSWVGEVLEATDGAGVDVALESVGGETGRLAFLSTAPGHGTMVVFGWASGAGTMFSTDEVARRGVTVSSGLAPYPTPAEARADAEQVLAAAASGDLHAPIGGTFSLADAAQAHRLLESRRSTGKLVLTTRGETPPDDHGGPS
ncbi:MAG: quinone oxidoreductase family protein [Microthrixaceae bacterium]